jgi:hypothetical protein
MKRLVHILKIGTLKVVYFAHFHSVIKYGLIFWVEKNEICGACSEYGVEERRIQGFWWGNLRVRDHLGYPGIDGG